MEYKITVVHTDKTPVNKGWEKTSRGVEAQCCSIALTTDINIAYKNKETHCADGVLCGSGEAYYYVVDEVK